jgi:excisionase family DNA binding protein
VVYPGDGQAVTRLAYSPDEAAELLGISRELINDLLRTGDLRSVTAGRRRLISKIALSEYLHDDPGSGSGQGSLIQEIAALPRLAYSPEEVMIVLGIGKTMFFDDRVRRAGIGQARWPPLRLSCSPRRVLGGRVVRDRGPSQRSHARQFGLIQSVLTSGEIFL